MTQKFQPLCVMYKRECMKGVVFIEPFICVELLQSAFDNPNLWISVIKFEHKIKCETHIESPFEKLEI